MPNKQGSKYPLRHDKRADFLTERYCYNHNFVVIGHLCSIHIPLSHLLPFLLCLVNFSASIQASGSAIKIGCMPVVGEPQGLLFIFLLQAFWKRQSSVISHLLDNSSLCYTARPGRISEV